MARSATGNIGAFLDMIAISELGQPLLDVSDDGYNVIVGSTAAHPHLFQDYSTHPNVLVTLNNKGLCSTAAGRYQLLARYYAAYKRQLHLPDFSPASQDAIAIQQIRERRAYNDILAGNLNAAIVKCANIWASLPGNSYRQHQNSLSVLNDAYVNSGGTLSGVKP